MNHFSYMKVTRNLYLYLLPSAIQFFSILKLLAIFWKTWNWLHFDWSNFTVWGGSSVEEPQWGGNFTLIVTESHGVARTPLALVTWRSQERTGRCAVTQYSSARCSPGRAVAALTLRAAPSGNTARDVTLYCLSVCILHLAYTQYSLPSFQCWFNPEMNLSEVLCLFGTFRFVLFVELWMFI